MHTLTNGWTTLRRNASGPIYNNYYSVVNPAVGCHYFLPGLQDPSQPLRGLLPILLLGEQTHNGCEQFA